MHRHDYTDRKALGAHGPDPVVVVRFQCANPSCCALWRVLPAFVARHLWYVWSAVESAALAALPPPAPPEPSPSLPSPSPSPRPTPSRRPSQRTMSRWRKRLASSARVLVQLFATLGAPVFIAMISLLVHGIDATRDALVAAYGEALGLPAKGRLAALAGHVHRAAPGLRLV